MYVSVKLSAILLELKFIAIFSKLSIILFTVSVNSCSTSLAPYIFAIIFIV